MEHLPRILAIVTGTVLAVGGAAPSARAEVHACRDATGALIYQVDPCIEVARKPIARPAPAPVPEEPPVPVPVPEATAPRKGPEIRECRDPDGNVVYQLDPCVEVKRRRVVRPEAAPAPAPAPAVAKLAPARTPKHARVSRRSDVLQRLLAERPEPKPRVAVRSTDPRFGSPERTWQTFVAAVRDGNRAAALACLTASALEEYGPGAEAIPLETFLATVNTITRVSARGEMGPFWTLRGERRNAPPKWVFLELTDQGTWKIAAL